MPGMNGLEVARRLRRSPEGQSVQLVALTGWGQEKDHERTREAGFDWHLLKPIDPSALSQVLSSPADFS
jgi:CheY-like chemotaxis protein